MATKNNPGKYDCYANAEPDEPMFVLLARDANAPKLIRLWADLREVRGENPEKIAEARACADACEEWCKANRPDMVHNPDPTRRHVQELREDLAVASARLA